MRENPSYAVRTRDGIRPISLIRLARPFAALSILVLIVGGCDLPVGTDSATDDRGKHPLEGIYDLTTAPADYFLPTMCPDTNIVYCFPPNPAVGWEITGVVAVTGVVAEGDVLRLKGEATINSYRAPQLFPHTAQHVLTTPAEPILRPAGGPVVADFANASFYSSPTLHLEGVASDGDITGAMHWQMGWGRSGSWMTGTFTLERRP